jgi:hypothetical protein
MPVEGDAVLSDDFEHDVKKLDALVRLGWL